MRCLDDYGCGRTKPTVGGDTPGQMVLDCIRKLTEPEQERASKQRSSVVSLTNTATWMYQTDESTPGWLWSRCLSQPQEVNWVRVSLFPMHLLFNCISSFEKFMIIIFHSSISVSSFTQLRKFFPSPSTKVPAPLLLTSFLLTFEVSLS